MSWITLLDSIPDLELVSYLPSFLQGLFKFLSDSNQDVHTATQIALDSFLLEIKKIAQFKLGLAASRRGRIRSSRKRRNSESEPHSQDTSRPGSADQPGQSDDEEESDEDSVTSGSDNGLASDDGEEDWIPGQDVQVDHPKILEIMVTFLGAFGTLKISV